MARLVLARIVRSLSLVAAGAIACAATPGCGGSAEVTYDAGNDAAPPLDAGSLPDTRDYCDPLVLAPTGDDPCELALPTGFLPARIFYDVDDDTVARELLPGADYCEGVGGFYVDDQEAPTTATLCPDTCDLLPDPAPAIMGTACGI